jgi:hypothetical protein
MNPSVPKHMTIDAPNGTGCQATDSDDTMESDSDYYSANEGEKCIRMDVEPTHKILTFSFGTSANTALTRVAN